MKKIILVYGSLAGVIVGSMFFIGAPLYDRGIITLDNGMLVGYTSMVVALSLIFFGVKNYRDSQGGAITFAKAFQIGILITILATVIYSISWEIAYRTVSRGYNEAMYEHQIDKLKEQVKGEEELKKQIRQLEDFAVLYENPLIRFGITCFEIFPIGLIISLIVAGLLRKKEFLPHQSS